MIGEVVREPTMQPRQPRVLLVEDDIDVAAGLGDYLQAHGVDVDFAYSAAQARALAADGGFDLFVLDVNLPGEDGISLCRELKTRWKLPQPVLFLTARGALDDKLQGFDAGAVDWMVKPFAPAELLARVRAITRQAAHAADAAPLVVGDYRLDPQTGLLAFAGRSLQLHASGAAIVACLLRAYPACVPRAQLLEALWGDDVPDSDPLRAHVWQLRQALLAAFEAQPVVTERGIGYRFEAGA